MNFAEIINALSSDTTGSLSLFSPELSICGAIVALLLVRLFNGDRRFPGSVVAICGTVLALGLAAWQFWDFRDGTTSKALSMSPSTFASFCCCFSCLSNI
jgi:hypothetical protein